MLNRHRLAALLLLPASPSTAVADADNLPRLLRPDIEPIPLIVGPDTTVVEGPLRDDGTVDYIAALNALLSEGVTPENNAYVVIAELTHPDEWPQDEPALRERVFELLGVTMPGDDAEYFISFDSYARQRAEDEGGPWAERVEPEPEHGGVWPAERDRRWVAERARALAGPWSDEDAPLVARWLATQHAALDRLAAGVRRERYYAPLIAEGDGDMLIEVLMPSLAEMRHMARGLRARAFHRLGAGEIDDAVDDIEAIKRFGHLMEQDSSLIGHLVGISIANMTRPIVGDVLGREDLTAEQISMLKAAIDASAARFPVHHAVDLGERFTYLDLTQRLTDHAQAEGVLGFFGIAAPFGWPVGHEWWLRYHHVLVAYFDPNRAMRRANAAYDELIDAFRLENLTLRQARLAELDDGQLFYSPLLAHPVIEVAWLAALLATGPDDARAGRVTTLVGRLLDEFLISGLGSSAAAVDRGYAGGILESTALAVAGHRLETGDYPASLDDLVPRWLEAVPADIFAPDPDGHPIRYRLEPQRVVVYSVGRNGVDNGGVDDPREGDITIEWPR